MRTLYWVRNDLRCTDNLALDYFCSHSEQGLVIWCPSASSHRAGNIRRAFINDCLNHFSASLQNHGQNLVRGQKTFVEYLPELLSSLEIQQVVYTREFAHDEASDETSVNQLCKERGVQVISFDQGTLVAEMDLPFSLDRMPFVFTAFRKKVEYQFKIRPAVSVPAFWPARLKVNLTGLSESTTGLGETNLVFQGGEAQALARLKSYLWTNHHVRTYKDTRNGMIHWDDSTKFSAWLNQGCLSARTVYHELKKYEAEHGANESTYWVVFELLWRDYFKFLSRKYGEKIFKLSGLAGAPDKSQKGNTAAFESWKQGETENDFINANMRELLKTGWMSNRGRQNVASYLIHQLQIPWTWGAAYFEEQLIDYDPDVNWGNWLYLSGNGTDPRARVFNPHRQAEQYDPASEYQLKWRDK